MDWVIILDSAVLRAKILENLEGCENEQSDQSCVFSLLGVYGSDFFLRVVARNGLRPSRSTRWLY